jgi:hypothetical protein
MGAAETAKEIVRIGSTAGLSKDVIDLLEKKLALLMDENIALAKENVVLIAKVSVLENENRNLRTQLQDAQPVVGAFHEFGGVLWKRTANGFEKYPYCKECPHHPVMMGMPPRGRPMFWRCSSEHHAPFQGLPKV